MDEPADNVTLTYGDFVPTPAWVKEVPAQNLTQMEVSDGAGKLVFFRNETLPQILLLPLSATGDVIADSKAAGFSLPGNAEKKIVNKVLAVATHPTQPVLYVWQDTATRADDIVIPKDDAELAYSHLLIYDISQDKPKLLMSTCSGVDFMFSRATASLNVGNNGKRLFVSNMRYKVSRGYGVAMGYYELNAKGLPILTGADPEEDPALVSGAADAVAAAESEADYGIAAQDTPEAETPAEQAKDKVTSGRGGGLTMLHMGNIGSRYQAGTAFYIDDAHTLMRSGTYLATYDTSNRSGRIAAVLIPRSNTRTTRLVVHPGLNMVYAIHPVGITRVLAWPIFQGYPSMFPQYVSIAPYVTYGRMAVVTKHDKLALGSAGRVMLLHLDKLGRVLPEVTQVKINATRVHAIIYSEKFDRLYVGTDVPLEVAP